MAAPSACLEPGCPNPAIDRGRCQDHRRTTSQRGYGAPHQRERRSALPGARCAECGCTKQLQRDHPVPDSMGGSRERRWLCDCSEHRCHSRKGLRITSRRAIV